MFKGFTPQLHKKYNNALYEYSIRHFWGDKNNAGVNYKRGKNKIPKKLNK